MSFLHGTEEYYQKFIELQEKLRKSEEERLKLEMKFNEMVQVSREEEQIYYRKLRAQYKRFLEEDRRRQERNERILRILERIESRAAMLAAKTQRFELLRKQYHAYLQRIFTNVKQQDEDQTPPRMPTIVEQKQPHNELARGPKVDVVKQYLSSLSSPTCREEVLKAARSNELLPFSDASSEDYNLPKYKSSASNLADQIIHTFHSRPKANARPNPEEEGRSWQSFCGTKLAPPRPPIRKPDDVELLDYGAAGDQYEFGEKRNLAEQLSEEKIVQDNYQNENFFYPREEDVRPSVRFHDQYLPESFSVGFQNPKSISPEPTVSESTIPRRPDLYEPKTPERVDYLQEPASAESRNHEEEDGANEEVGSHEIPQFEDDQKPEGETPKANGDGVEESCFEDEEGRIEDEDNVAIEQIEEDVQDETKSTPQSEQNDEAFVNGEVTGNDNQNEVKDQDQVETVVDDEAKKEVIDVRDDVEETRAQLGHEETVQYGSNEGDQSLQYASSNKGDQPIQYDKHGQPIQYDEQGQVIQHDEQGQAMQYDEHGQPIHYDEQGQPVVYDDFIQYDEQGRPIQYDELGRPIQYDNEQGRPIQYDDLQGQPIQYDEQNRTIQYDEQGRPIEYDEPIQYDGSQSRPIQYDEQNRPIQYDEQGRPIQYDDVQGQPIQYDEQNRTVQYDAQARPIQYDEHGRPIQYDDSQTRPVQYDEQNRPIQYNEQGRPIQYDDLQGRPIQYDEQNRPVQYDEQGRPIQYDELGRPIQYDDSQGRPIQYDEQNQPVQYDEQGQPIQYDEQGRPIQYDGGQERPIQYDEHGRPILYDEQGRPTHYDEKGEPIPYDQQDGPIHYDEQGRPVQYDEQGHPIQYDEQGQYYDEQGQPLYQYDPNNEYYQQQQYEEHGPDVQQNQDQIGSPTVIEKGETASVVHPPNESEKEVEGKKEEGELETPKQKPNVMDMLDTDTESTRQEARVSNDSDFDFSNS